MSKQKLIRNHFQHEFFRSLGDHLDSGWFALNNPVFGNGTWVCIVYRNKND